MEPKKIPYQQVLGRMPVLGEDEMASLAAEGLAIREADERDGTNAFLEAAFADAVSDEPDYEW